MSILIAFTLMVATPIESDVNFHAPEIKPGMTADDVTQLMGRPDQISRMILLRRHLEQWIYTEANIRIDLMCVPGEQPRVIQALGGIPNPK